MLEGMEKKMQTTQGSTVFGFRWLAGNEGLEEKIVNTVWVVSTE